MKAGLKIFGLFPLFAALFASSVRAGDSGLVKVDAQVYDEGFRKKVSVFGTGGLLEKDGRYFVVTAAHVAMQTKPVLTMDGETLQILRRDTIAAADMDWFEVKKPHSQPLAKWDDQAGFVMTEPGAAEAATLSVGVEKFYMPHPTWAQSDAGENSQASQLGRPTNTGNIFMQKKVLPVTIQAGESGTPMFERETDNDGVTRWVFGGVAQSYDRNFPYSFFGRESRDEFLDGDTPTDANNERPGPSRVTFNYRVDDRTTWQRRFGMTYMDLGNGIREIVPSAGDASGVTGDRSGVTGDRSGVTGDRSGVTGDRSGVTGDRSGSTQQINAERDVYEQFHISPGIQVRGKACIGLGDWNGAYTFADREALNILRIQYNPMDTACLKAGSPLQPLLERRLKKLFPHSSVQGKWLLGEEKDRNNGKSALLKVTKEGVLVRIAVTDKATNKKTWLTIKLNPHGGYAGRPFRPLIRVPAPDGGKPYIVDLRYFYFFDEEVEPRFRLDDPTIRLVREGEKDVRFLEFNQPEPNEPGVGAELPCVDSGARRENTNLPQLIKTADEVSAIVN